MSQTPQTPQTSPGPRTPTLDPVQGQMPFTAANTETAEMLVRRGLENADERRARSGLRRLRRAGHVLRSYPLPALALALLFVSLVLWAVGQHNAAQWPLFAIIVIGGVPLCWETLNQIMHGEFGVDLIAILAIGGSLLLGEYLAGALVVLMLSGGEALEAYALQRARSSLAALAERSPRWAHIRRSQHGSQLETVGADAVEAGMEIVVKPGELVPVDGTVIGGASNISEADLTGEPLPVRKELGAIVLSGSVNLDGVLDIRASRPAAESHYAQIVRLVEEAQKSKAPIHRLADRYAVWFTGLSLTLAGLAWAVSGNSVHALAVLVVATPCPLILATPIAIMSGMNRAAKIGLIVKGGAVMEQLGEVNVAIFDKTGTLTLGRPQLVDVLLVEDVIDPEQRGASAADAETISSAAPGVPLRSPEPAPAPEAGAGVIAHSQNNSSIRELGTHALLQLAASVEQFSDHILARAVVQAAVDRDIPLLPAGEMEEISGKGVRARVSGVQEINACNTAHEMTTMANSGKRAHVALSVMIPLTTTQSIAVAVGNRAYLRHLAIPIPERLAAERVHLAEDGKLASFLALDGRVVALLVFADTARAEVARLAPELRATGIRQIMLLTGDSETVAKQVGTLAGVDRVVAQCLPEDKVNVVAGLQKDGYHVLMVGDGVNDAPALALATVGVAVGTQGLNASAAIADAVLLSTDIMQIAAAVRLGRHVLRIAKQGIWVGIALSIGAMALAAAGYIPPAVGAVLQEGIDVLVILNALRAGRPAPAGR